VRPGNTCYGIDPVVRLLYPDTCNCRCEHCWSSTQNNLFIQTRNLHGPTFYSTQVPDTVCQNGHRFAWDPPNGGPMVVDVPSRDDRREARRERMNVESAFYSFLLVTARRCGATSGPWACLPTSGGAVGMCRERNAGGRSRGICGDLYLWSFQGNANVTPTTQYLPTHMPPINGTE
jgi:hypothetical protein